MRPRSDTAPETVSPRPPHGPESLTDREVEVVEAYIKHGHYKPIGEELSIAYQTVKNHATSIIAKTGAVSMGQAAVYYDRWARCPE